ncbi:hypothetical protein amrb99_97710 [Actinomadura sp. RB99]|uniref:hypothetical protein n=1 Tax=Actinomadura sp. RB99 TaxID=2691577 RepID=UPI001689FF4C|nr:hypothetical protein [Actinomadura sp. RB99]MBD2900762.1 hypothetical protein [Actinomadura sp. RB99]
MSGLGEIRTALAALLDDVEGLSAYAYRPASVPNLPAAVISPSSAEYATPMQARRGQDIYQFDVLVLVPFVDAEVAQATLDELISADGPIRAALAASPHLGPGYGTTAYATALADYGVTIGGADEQQNLGATLRVTVRTTTG